MPLAFESFGRLGTKSAAALRSLACEASGHQRSALEPSPTRRLARYRGELERILLFHLADAALLALGVAGAPAVPSCPAPTSLAPDAAAIAPSLRPVRARRARAVAAGTVGRPESGLRA